VYAEINEQILPLFEQVKNYRAQMILTLQKANQFYSKADAIFEAVQIAEKAVGKEYRMPIGQGRRSGALEIRKWLGDSRKTRENDESIGMLPNPHELTEAAYDGKIPEWVEQYKQESD